jgi:hypothetical protein
LKACERDCQGSTICDVSSVASQTWKISVITSNDPKDTAHASAEEVVPEIEKEPAYRIGN